MWEKMLLTLNKPLQLDLSIKAIKIRDNLNAKKIPKQTSTHP